MSYNYILLLLCFVHNIKTDSTGIGQGFYIPKLSLIEDNGSGKSIFKNIPPECIQAVPSEISRKESTYFETPDAFYSKIGQEASLAAEVIDGFTLGSTADAASVSIDKENLEIKGMSYEIYAMTGFWDFIPDCYGTVQLAEDFTRAFESLPREIANSVITNSWLHYDTFFKTYGSHVTKRISHGSKIVRHVFSKSNEHISTEDFLIKACASLKDIGLTSCATFTDADYKRVDGLSISDNLSFRGGSAETRAKLMNGINKQLVKEFMQESRLTEQPISLQYESMWDFLKIRYFGTEHFAKAVILESFYLGFLNTGCSYKTERGNELRKFVQTGNGAGIPSFECQLAPMGCRTDNDCNFGSDLSSCYCYGNSCVEEEKLNDPRHTIKTSRYVRVYYDQSSTWVGSNLSCSYRIGIWCGCNKSWGGGWKTVWPTQSYSNELHIYRQAHLKLKTL